MHWRRPGRWLVLGLMAGVLASPAAFGQQKYRLRDRYAAGDLCVVDTSTDVNMMVTISARGDSKTVPVVTRDRETYREQVLGVDGERLTGLRRTYSIARKVVVDPMLQETRTISPLQGKTVTIQRKSGKVLVSANRGQLPEAIRRMMVEVLDHPDMLFFPAAEVAVGEEWTVDPKLLGAIFPDMQKAEVKYQFQGVTPYGGHSCARIRVTMNMESESKDVGAPLTAQLTGDLYHALDLKRTLAIELTGPSTMQAEEQENGVTYAVAGDGTLRIKETRRWLRVRGQPVAAKRTAAARRR